MNRVPRTSIAHAFRRMALPLASYYAVTLALPLVNGAARSGAFVEHAVVVLVVPPVAIILACAIPKTAHVLASAAHSFLAGGRPRLYICGDRSAEQRVSLRSCAWLASYRRR
jgi:hypothetical protein